MLVVLIKNTSLIDSVYVSARLFSLYKLWEANATGLGSGQDSLCRRKAQDQHDRNGQVHQQAA